MAVKSSANKRLLLSNFKLNSLLEITLAINENLSIEYLLKKYKKILTEDLEIGKVVIFNKTKDGWKSVINSGFPDNLIENNEFIEWLKDFSEISYVSADQSKIVEEVDIIIPVINKNEAVAFVLIGDIDEESEGVSPVIKHLKFIQTLSNIIIVAIENIRLYNESLRQVAIKREMELASKMQTMLIPSDNKLPWNEHVHFRAFYHPHYDVGGDYYDVLILSEDEIGFCIADVSGKGISAAILMSNFQANLRALFTNQIELTVLVNKLNERVLESANGEKFITLFLAKFNYKTKQLTYINAGHNPPLYYEIEKLKLSQLKSGCVGIGMLDEIPKVKTETLQLTGPTKLLLYTDGLVELIEGDDIGYGYKFIEQEISNNGPIDENIREIIHQQKIEEGNDAIFDDISILGLEFSAR